MKLHAVALLASALFFGGCAESVEEIQVSTATDSGTGSTDSSSAKDSSTAPPDTGTVEEDTMPVEEDTGEVTDSGEFPDFGGGDDSGGGTIDPDAGGGGSDAGGGGGGSCMTNAECPGGCCDTSAGKCGVEIIPGLCFAI